MPLLTTPSSAPRTAVSYITIGSLLVVWAATWYFFLTPQTRLTQFLDAGVFFSGLALLIIGFAIGQIGRAARDAELPPKEATAAEARIDQTAAARGALPAAGSPPPVASPNQVSTAAPGA